MEDEHAENAPPQPPVPPIVPQPLVAPVAPVAPATLYPPPVPVPPARPGRTAALVIGIVVGAIVVIGGLAVAVFFVAQSAISSLENAGPGPAWPNDADTPSEIEQLPLVEGETALPIAAEPLACEVECFTPGMLSLAVPSPGSVDELGLPVTEWEFGEYESSSPASEWTNSKRGWIETEGEPEECFFTYLTVPIAATIDEGPTTSINPIDYLGYHYSEDGYSYLDVTSRLFRNSTTAEEHMTSVSAMVPGCHDYDFGTGESYWTADVTPLPALTLPPSVGATGWVEDGPFGRFYVIDLQRGNLVVRLSLSSNGAITEEDFRGFTEEYAGKLADLAVS